MLRDRELWTLDLGVLSDDDDALVGDRESLSVRSQVDTDLGARAHVDVLVDDGVADHGVAPDVDVVHQHRPLDLGEGVHVHTGGEDRRPVVPIDARRGGRTR